MHSHWRRFNIQIRHFGDHKSISRVCIASLVGGVRLGCTRPALQIIFLFFSYCSNVNLCSIPKGALDRFTALIWLYVDTKREVPHRGHAREARNGSAFLPFNRHR